MIPLSPNFWFDLSPPALAASSEQALFIIFCAMIIFGTAFRIVAKSKKEDRYLKKSTFKVAHLLLWMGVLGMILYFFSYEKVYFLGARFWFIIWLAGIIFWAYKIWKYSAKTVPELKEKNEALAEENKYLPRKRKRKTKKR